MNYQYGGPVPDSIIIEPTVRNTYRVWLKDETQPRRIIQAKVGKYRQIQIEARLIGVVIRVGQFWQANDKGKYKTRKEALDFIVESLS